MMRWIDRQLAVAIHERQLAEHGGPSGIRDESLLESALARPLQLLAYGDPAPGIEELAAALAFGLARNHPFVDGNKRTAYVAMRTFLVLNGTDLSASPEERFQVFQALADGRLSETALASWLRTHLEAFRVQEPVQRYGVRTRTLKKAPRSRARKSAKK